MYLKFKPKYMLIQIIGMSIKSEKQKFKTNY